MKALLINDLPLAEALDRAPMRAVRGGFCGTPVPRPVITLPEFPAMPPFPAMPEIPAVAVPPVLPLPGRIVPL